MTTNVTLFEVECLEIAVKGYFNMLSSSFQGIRLKLGGYPLHSHGWLVLKFGKAYSRKQAE